ncbi:MAG: 30S ribosomal protein S5, partial [Verrucomicrobiota bacterium]|nr:30S ribosomal protein S5 [Verrucomicrobiota bacterium]
PGAEETPPPSETPAPAAPAAAAAPGAATPATTTAPAPAPARQNDRGPRGGGNRGGGGGRGPGGPGGPGGRGGNRRGGPRERRAPAVVTDSEGNELTEKVVFINRSSKVVKGGRRFGFSALVVTGNRKGGVGVGIGKAREVVTAIQKGNEDARREMVKVSLHGATLPHEVYSVYDGARVLLRPASPGTGIIAGKTVRAVLESAGVRDVLSKSLGSNNPANVAKATLQALQSLRLREDVYKARGKKLD